VSQGEKSALSLQQVVAAPLLGVLQAGTQIAAVNADTIKELLREGLPVVAPPLLAVKSAEFAFPIRVRRCSRELGGNRGSSEVASDDLKRFLRMRGITIKVTLDGIATTGVAGPAPVVQMTIKTRVEAASSAMIDAGVSRVAK
jgi:hypothetical protein